MPKYDDFDLDLKVEVVSPNNGECLARSHVINSHDGYCFESLDGTCIPATQAQSCASRNPRGNVCEC